MPARIALINLAQDLRYGLRAMRQNPGFTAIVMATLALGIGSNTAMFSVVDALLLRPLPYYLPEQLVTVGEIVNQDRGTGGFSAGSLLDFRERNGAFEGPAGWTDRAFNLSGGRDVPEQVEGMRVSWDFFKVLGVAPALGRTFSESDDRPGAPRTAVLSHALWHRRFGGDPAVVGRSVTVDGAPCIIAGIMPARFRFFRGPEMWMPLSLERATAGRGTYFLSGVARLKGGVSLSQAMAQADAIAKGLHAAAGDTRQWSARVTLLKDAFVAQKERERLLVLLGAVGFVLLIACVNVANLLLARATARRRELAMRAALGAGRGRLLAQMLVESLLLALGGGILGLLLAAGATRFLPALVSRALLDGRPEVALDARVLAFTFVLALLTGLVFGLLPAWRAARSDPQEAIKAGVAGGLARGRLRGALVVAEFSCSLVLLACSGLMIRSLVAMQNVDLGFRRDHLLTMRLAMAERRFPAPPQITAFYRQALETASAIPGVRAAGISIGQAPWDTPDATAFQLPGQPAPTRGKVLAAALERVSPEYFRIMGIRVRQGRVFDARDDENTPPVAVVSQTFVRMYLSGQQPLGQRVVLGKGIEIVGVVGDVKFGGPEAASVPILYLPMTQSPRAGGALALLTSGDPAALAPAVRAALAQVDRDTPLTGIKTMDRIAADSMLQPRLQAGVMAVFAGLALVLSALGIYGMMSYTVARGTREIGVRIALGATAGDVLRLVLGAALRMAAAGLLTGLAAAFALTRLLSSLLFQVKPADPPTFVAVSLLLVLVALVAGYIPARRAMRIDPMAVLRDE